VVRIDVGPLAAWLARHRWWRVTTGVVAGAGVVQVLQFTCTAPNDGLRPYLTDEVEHAMLATVHDTMEIGRLRRVAAAAAGVGVVEVSRAAERARSGVRAGRRADSFGRAVSEATTARDSADAWRLAYAARTAQAIALAAAGGRRSIALVAAAEENRLLDSALIWSEGRAARADSVIRLLRGEGRADSRVGRVWVRAESRWEGRRP
jgi:hypothetical protein